MNKIDPLYTPLREWCDDYFKIDRKEYFVTALKIASYCTIVFPLVVAAIQLVLSRAPSAPSAPKVAKTWLNDIQINDQLRLMLKGREKFCYIDSISVDKLHVRKSLYPVLQTHTGKTVERLFGTIETIFIPLHVNGCHWALVKADLLSKKMHYYDSLSWKPPKSIENITAYLNLVAKQESVPLEPGAFAPIQEQCPQQENGYDCGIFVLLAASCLIENRPLAYSQKDASLKRLEIVQP